MYAIIINNKVSAIYENIPNLDSKDAALIVSCDENVNIGWNYSPELGCTEQTIEEVKALKQLEITNKAQEILSEIQTNYCSTEIITWNQQYDESIKYKQNSSSSVPLLSSIAASRGISIDTLASSIITNRSYWVAITGNIIGQKSSYQDKLNSFTSVSDVNSLNISYYVPTYNTAEIDSIAQILESNNAIIESTNKQNTITKLQSIINSMEDNVQKTALLGIISILESL